MASEPGWPRVGAHARAASTRRRVGRVGRSLRCDRGSGFVRGHRVAGRADQRRRIRRLLRRLRQPHALAAVPRRGARAELRTAVVAGLRLGEPPVRRGGRGVGHAGCDGVGSRLPPATRPDDAARAPTRRANRLLPAHAVPAARAVHADPVAPRAHRRPARRGSRRLPGSGRGNELCPARPPAHRRDRRRRAARTRRPLRAGRRVPDLDRHRGDHAASDASAGDRTGPPDPGRPRRPRFRHARRRPSRLHEGPPAARQGSGASCSPKAPCRHRVT